MFHLRLPANLLMFLCCVMGGLTSRSRIGITEAFSTTTTPRQGQTQAQAFHDTLLSRRTINEFEPVLPNYWEMYLDEAVEAATYAPNHKRTEPWRFHLLGTHAIQRVCELNAALVTRKKGPEAGEKKLKRWLAMPGWLVVTQVIDSEESENDTKYTSDPTSVTREDYAACCCAVQNLCLSLHANGIGTKWTTGPVNFDDRFAEAAGLSENELVVGTIWFGKPSGKPPLPPKKRKTLADVFVKHS
jgi:nitroreductase